MDCAGREQCLLFRMGTPILVDKKESHKTGLDASEDMSDRTTPCSRCHELDVRHVGCSGGVVSYGIQWRVNMPPKVSG